MKKMSVNNKQFMFTNEVLYERNISDRIWPLFLQAQIDKDLDQAILAVKCYYLYTQQWYQKQSPDIGEKINKLLLPPRAATVQNAQANAIYRQKTWKEVNAVWMQICNCLEGYGLFKRSFVSDPNQLALHSR